MGSEALCVEGGVLAAAAPPFLAVHFHRTHQPASSRRRPSSLSSSATLAELFRDSSSLSSLSPSLSPSLSSSPSLHGLPQPAPFSASSPFLSLVSRLSSSFSSSSEEVFLCPEAVFLRIYCLLTNLEVTFLPSLYPSSRALGTLPAAFYNDGVLRGRSLQFLLQEERDLDALLASSLQSSSRSSSRTSAASASPASPACSQSSFSLLKADSEALTACIETKLSEVLDFTLWCYEPCYSRFTARVYRHSLPGVYAPFFLLQRRRQVAARLRGVDSVHILRSFLEILERLRSLERERGSQSPAARFLLADNPTKADVKLYAYLSVLFQIPSEYTPWHSAGASPEHKKGERTPGETPLSAASLRAAKEEARRASGCSSSPVDGEVSAGPGGCEKKGELSSSSGSNSEGKEKEEKEEKEKSANFFSRATLSTGSSRSKFFRTKQHKQDLLSRLESLLPVAQNYLRMFDLFLAETTSKLKLSSSSSSSSFSSSSSSSSASGVKKVEASAGAGVAATVSPFSLPAKKVLVCLESEEGGEKCTVPDGEEEKPWKDASTLLAGIATVGLLSLCLR
ncbi:hypothetical protein TGVAND_267090 [Toxoplasma gondii VAND]|uniref:Mitochondrial outer membrane transport complex Sam37/metaxin N-terminal domain-containing protein n=1 Tax=Toxoplasma gondii VAND TaxID=933077 RepID=A0A086PN25_TOXGO|nr:hypothetical protein TGVAND_267090 [Toxoplasma gondii VAND]